MLKKRHNPHKLHHHKSQDVNLMPHKIPTEVLNFYKPYKTSLLICKLGSTALRIGNELIKRHFSNIIPTTFFRNVLHDHKDHLLTDLKKCMNCKGDPPPFWWRKRGINWYVKREVLSFISKSDNGAHSLCFQSSKFLFCFANHLSLYLILELICYARAIMLIAIYFNFILYAWIEEELAIYSI